MSAMDAELKQQCDLEVTSSANPASAATAQAETARLKADQVTTAILLDPSAHARNASTGATQNAWFPEWFLPGDILVGGPDTNSVARTYSQAEWRNAFGFTFDYRRDEVQKQQWFRAFKEGCPTCPDPNDATAAFAYDSLNMLFWGIQAAGPRLTAQNLDKGLHAIPPNGSPNPYKPAAYFAPGNYTFIKDAMQIWWDGSGEAPGDPVPGCYRLPNEGQRLRAGDWKLGDGDIQEPGSPCQGSPSAAV